MAQSGRVKVTASKLFNVTPEKDFKEKPKKSILHQFVQLLQFANDLTLRLLFVIWINMKSEFTRN